MKKFLALCVLVLGAFVAKADHITGGEMYYSFEGIVNGEYKYRVTLKFFMRCNSGRQFYNPAIVSIFNKKTSGLITTITVPLDNQQTMSYTNTNPCITNPPMVCYEVGYYGFDVLLPGSIDGYKVASQVTFRIQGINNFTVGYQAGATYTTDIPGTKDVSSGPTNNSAIFTGSDLVIVCADNAFTYSFAANDKDGDELRYYFCEAYTHSNIGGGTVSGNPPGIPPYQPVPYGNPFNGQNPLGGKVSINSRTGLITGIAPSAGVYVVTVCVEEIRNGVVIATQRKDIQINIAPCTIAGAVLSPEYMLCKDTKTISLSNQSASPLIQTQNWTIFDQAGSPLTGSTTPNVSFTFPDTGIYKIKLVVNSGLPCSDSTTSFAKVYPGFIPDFSFNGECFNKPTNFADASTTVYGTVNSWRWDFGEPGTDTDLSILPNPSYTFPSKGIKGTLLVVGNSVGCVDSLYDYPGIIDKPPLKLAFRDTLICVNDPVRLNATAIGNYQWTPTLNMTGANTPTPVVSPGATTTYYADYDDNGCVNRDSVTVRVTDQVNLQVMNDTTICEGDTVQLRIVSDGFKYSWSAASQILNASVPNPTVITRSRTAYVVTASIGGCTTTEDIVVNTAPYPFVNAGPDTMICDKTTAQLNATIRGSTFTWSPAASLVNSNQLNPIVIARTSTSYRLTVYDDKGCPKPGFDQVVVTVLPPIRPNAGNDTTIIRGQPLQLNATGGIAYKWTPAAGLSNATIADPVATFVNFGDSVRYKVEVYNQAGCADSAFLSVKIFNTLPTVFVPTAFTPDRDGKNDLLRPIAVGMKQLEYFHVYNRWGQLVFSTMSSKLGWDGTLGGKMQNSGLYIWAVKAIDYSGKPYMQKGTAVLIR